MSYLADRTASPGYWLLLAVALWVLYKLFERSCENSPLLEDEPQPEPKAFEPDPAHIKAILAELRSPLPQFAKRDAGAEYPDPRDVADLARGTSKNVLIAAVRELS